MTTVIDVVLATIAIGASLAVLWIAWRHEARRDRHRRLP